MSIYLAFAATFPEQVIYLMYVLPIKVKYLGIMYAVMVVYEFIKFDTVGRIIIGASLLNFVVFFLLTRKKLLKLPIIAIRPSGMHMFMCIQMFRAVLVIPFAFRAEAASERVAIGIVNRDDSLYSKMLLSFYEENGLFTSYVSVYIGEEEEVQGWFEEGRLDMYLVIPENFADSMTYLEHLPVQAVISTRKPAVEIMLTNLLKAYEKATEPRIPKRPSLQDAH